MVLQTIEELDQLRKSFERLDRNFVTKVNINIDINKIKREITEDLKRELQGRSSYGIGI